MLLCLLQDISCPITVSWKAEGANPQIIAVFMRIHKMGGVWPITGRLTHVSFLLSNTEIMFDVIVPLMSLNTSKPSSTVNWKTYFVWWQHICNRFQINYLNNGKNPYKLKRMYKSSFESNFDLNPLRNEKKITYDIDLPYFNSISLRFLTRNLCATQQEVLFGLTWTNPIFILRGLPSKL